MLEHTSLDVVCGYAGSAELTLHHTFTSLTHLLILEIYKYFTHSISSINCKMDLERTMTGQDFHLSLASAVVKINT